MKLRLKRLLYAVGVIFLLQVLLALTGWQGMVAKWLAVPDETLQVEPTYVVVLGGGGIPSVSGLLRTYYAADVALRYPGSTLVVSLPADKDPENSSVGRMKRELVMRGVLRDRIRMEYRGRNTHEQAVAIRKMLPEEAGDFPVMLVSSPYHLRRSIRCFQREGFTLVGGLPAYSQGAEADFGKGTYWRYAVWNRLSDQPQMLRELCALLVYRMKGWI